MSYGLMIYNNDLEIQMDGTYKNFSLHDSGLWSLSPRWEWHSFSPTINPPMIVTRPSETYYTAGNFDKNASYEYVGQYVWADDYFTLPYIVFTEASVSEIPSGAYGLAVYNDSGNLVFHSHNKWCRIISITTFSTPDAVLPEETIDITVEDADNNYFILRPLCYAQFDTGGFTYIFVLAMKKVDSVTIRVAGYYIDQIPMHLGTLNMFSDISTLIEVNV